MDIGIGLLFGLAVHAGCVALGLIFERGRTAWKAVKLNLGVLALFDLTQNLFRPLVGGLIAVCVNVAGGGLLSLPSDGWYFALALLAYALVIDLMEYLIHRAQHRFAFLWAFHSLHHSDPAMNVSTTMRHHFLEQLGKGLLIGLAAGLLFKIDAAVIGAYVLFTLYNFFPHMNVRLGFGAWSAVLNCPQYHRLHHSALPEHRNCNYAAVFTFFDVLLGTYKRPKADEYPPTGIDGGQQPASILESVTWPSRFFGNVRSPRRRTNRSGA